MGTANRSKFALPLPALALAAAAPVFAAGSSIDESSASWPSSAFVDATTEGATTLWSDAAGTVHLREHQASA